MHIESDLTDAFRLAQAEDFVAEFIEKPPGESWSVVVNDCRICLPARLHST